MSARITLAGHLNDYRQQSAFRSYLTIAAYSMFLNIIRV